ncbi:PREDICTED: very-long-chain (3R)-3-hydroxyacyl-CoA dehydratase 2 [Nicotiana attenuata]|uniref:Very-long-chain (3R)-3-hydroxyacyl-CoA dehydratase n=1 Tax=Nicotiana attenuata TaxID=49451 RepID=A0A314L711_NICAT|nr:PREDICTED: very-long-chain (3R)-3-hydroxyacyl-CoA dehydratase 2 [Nicotiana attenuata]OIT37406.1 very-long-chain (3r)-3-hydroxyacyl-coa dehydratase pasticcino 2 [Nicotiana attenuata]
MAKLKNLYLFSYNSLQFLGWTVALFRILSNFISTQSVTGTYASAGELICLLQCCAFLEVVHGAIGIVPSGAVLPLMQWSGRTHFLLAIVRRIVEVQESPSVFMTFLAWSLSEVIRYSHYALSCIGSPPYFITYLRYTAFILLYPVGIGPGEMWLMYQALPFIKKRNLYADSLPFSYCNFVKVLLLVYPFLWLNLYLHLFKQRRSKLGKHQKTKKI